MAENYFRRLRLPELPNLNAPLFNAMGVLRNNTTSSFLPVVLFVPCTASASGKRAFVQNRYEFCEETQYGREKTKTFSGSFGPKTTSRDFAQPGQKPAHLCAATDAFFR